MFLNILVTDYLTWLETMSFAEFGECGNTRNWVGMRDWIFGFDVFVHDNS